MEKYVDLNGKRYDFPQDWIDRERINLQNENPTLSRPVIKREIRGLMESTVRNGGYSTLIQNSNLGNCVPPWIHAYSTPAPPSPLERLAGFEEENYKEGRKEKMKGILEKRKGKIKRILEEEFEYLSGGLKEENPHEYQFQLNLYLAKNRRRINALMAQDSRTWLAVKAREKKKEGFLKRLRGLVRKK